MNPTPFEKRLLDLQLLPRPETAEELAFLEDYMKWKAAGGPAKLQADQAARVRAQWSRTYAGISDREALTSGVRRGARATKAPL